MNTIKATRNVKISIDGTQYHIYAGHPLKHDVSEDQLKTLLDSGLFVIDKGVKSEPKKQAKK